MPVTTSSSSPSACSATCVAARPRRRWSPPASPASSPAPPSPTWSPRAPSPSPWWRRWVSPRRKPGQWKWPPRSTARSCRPWWAQRPSWWWSTSAFPTWISSSTPSCRRPSPTSPCSTSSIWKRSSSACSPSVAISPSPGCVAWPALPSAPPSSAASPWRSTTVWAGSSPPWVITPCRGSPCCWPPPMWACWRSPPAMNRWQPKIPTSRSPSCPTPAPCCSPACTSCCRWWYWYGVWWSSASPPACPPSGAPSCWWSFCWPSVRCSTGYAPTANMTTAPYGTASSTCAKAWWPEPATWSASVSPPPLPAS